MCQQCDNREPAEDCTESAVHPLVMTSPALTHQSEHYPASWRGKVPKRVRMAQTVRADFAFLAKPGTVCKNGMEYYVTVNSHGAIAAICDNDERLGLKPYEFEIIEWHE